MHAAATAGEAEQREGEGEEEEAEEEDEGRVSPSPPGLPTRTRSSWSPPGPLASCAAVEAPTRPVPPRMTTRFRLLPAGGEGRASPSEEEEEEEEEAAAAARAPTVVLAVERAPAESSRRRLWSCGFGLFAAVVRLSGLPPTAVARPLIRFIASAGIGREEEASIRTELRGDNGTKRNCSFFFFVSRF